MGWDKRISPVKHTIVIKGKFYYGFTCLISYENYAFLLLSSIQQLTWMTVHVGLATFNKMTQIV